MVGGFAFQEVGFIWFRFMDGIDGAALAVWGHEGNPVAVFKSKVGGGVFGKCLLRDLNVDMAIRVAIPFKVLSKEEVCVTHEVCGDFVVEKALEAGSLMHQTPRRRRNRQRRYPRVYCVGGSKGVCHR